jgi:hypothetical protein
MLEFIELLHFSKLVDCSLADESLREIQNELLRNPLQGDVMQGTGGCRKMRFGDASRGKGKGYQNNKKTIYER